MSVWRFASHEPTPANDDIVPGFVVGQLLNLVRIINESAQLAAKSTNIDTRRLRLDLAREKLREFEFIAAKYPRIKATNLNELKAGIAAIQVEIDATFELHPLQRGGIYDGWEYRAVMHFSTPLEHLLLHGTRDLEQTRMPGAPPGDYGHWRARTKTLRQMGVDMDEPAPAWVPLEVQVRNGDDWGYRDFLVALRLAAETPGLIEHRHNAVFAAASDPRWGKYRGLIGHRAEDLCGWFFPRFIDTIPGLPYTAVTAMWDVALDTPNRISDASDDQLLKIKGIGPVTLRKLRARCAEILEGRDEVRLDRIRQSK
ncbi:hypothetical protein [Duganella callida]|uniref:Uncharacterized protein n=1 Tax=Duganella callida TaxID=2561932 RepID=A0A4Y9S3N8_9BURK|nr:hypothetical protein [Duganella callida]TFW15930.1 hypothetical protein E4L98_24865 [Duganella callida]